MTIHEMQDLNRKTMDMIRAVIRPGMTLKQVRVLCEDYLLQNGADSFWYWDVGAFVFGGGETAVSVSGRTYETAERIIRENDIVTIDLSPQKEKVWGDYARTIILENGCVVQEAEQIQNPEWREGLQMEAWLHEEMLRFVGEDTTFEELYFYINALIEEKGYVNLDFAGNLGHSIVREKGDRIYTEKGNKEKLSAVEAFTFEPHIARQGSVYGFKLENIYSWTKNGLIEL